MEERWASQKYPRNRGKHVSYYNRRSRRAEVDNKLSDTVVIKSI